MVCKEFAFACKGVQRPANRGFLRLPRFGLHPSAGPCGPLLRRIVRRILRRAARRVFGSLRRPREVLRPNLEVVLLRDRRAVS